MSAFKIPAPAGHLPKNRFFFEMPDGAEESLPKLDYLPIEADEWLKSIEGRTLPFREYILGLVEASHPELGTKMREARLTRDQVQEFYDAWRGAGTVDEGKSSGSSQS